MSQENPSNAVETNVTKNPFEDHPLRALNIEKLKTEERRDAIKDKMDETKTGHPVPFEEFKKLNTQKTAIERSLGLIEDAIAKAKAQEDDGGAFNEALRRNGTN